MYEENQDPLSSLVHLYVDGAFSRRERLVAKHKGSIATATAAVTARGVAKAQPRQYRFFAASADSN